MDEFLFTDKTEEILKERARLLAREKETTRAEGETVQLVEFLLAAEHYGIDSQFVQEVTILRDFTAIPHTPSFVLGIINVRGKIISVLDIKSFLNLPAKGITELNKLIVIKDGQREVGILADEVVGVQRVETGQILPLPLTMGSEGTEFLRGVLANGLIIINAQKFLQDPRIIIDHGQEAI